MKGVVLLDIFSKCPLNEGIRQRKVPIVERYVFTPLASIYVNLLEQKTAFT